MRPINHLPTERVNSIDVLRGLTIMLMVFVNEVAGVRETPSWLRHVAGGVDGMTVVDWVFPGFLFIVGMSIPLALNNRISKGDTFWQLQKHIGVRTLGLLVLGVFMVNAEGGFNEDAMAISVNLWTFLIYPFAIMVWNKYAFNEKAWSYLLRFVGVAGLLMLAFLFRGGDDGTEFITPRWWGILGLIGWSYLAACIIYQVTKGNKYYLAAAVGVCTLIFVLGKTEISQNLLLGWTRALTGHATHTGIALSGMVLTLIFLDNQESRPLRVRINEALAFGAILFVVGALLRPYFIISKPGATPTWGLYSSACGILVFIVLYWIVDLRRADRWTEFLKPAASDPLLTYIIPFIMWASYDLFDFYILPDSYREGITGIVYCIVYAFAVVWVVRWLHALKIRLQL